MIAVAELRMSLNRSVLAAIGVAVLALPSCGRLQPSGSGASTQPSAGSSLQQMGPSLVEGVANPIGTYVWAVRSDQILRSTDDGSTWGDVTPPGLVAATGWFFLNDSQAYVSQLAATGEVEVFSTWDGGASWSSSRVTVQNVAGGDGSVSISFSDEDHGLMAVQTVHSSSTAEVELFSTKDGGRGWTSLGLQPLLGPMAFSDVQVVWAPGDAAGQVLYRSDDGGAIWSPVELPLPPSGDFTTIGVPSFHGSFGAVLVLEGDSLLMFESEDAGTTWRLASNGPTDPNSYSLSAAFIPFDAADSGHIYVGFGGELFETSAASGTWSTLTLPVQGFVSDVDGFDAHAVAVVEESTCPKTADSCLDATSVIDTTDGGDGWTVANPPQTV